MSAYVVERSDGLQRLAPDWEGLAERVDAAPFQWPGWIEAWWRAFGSGRLEVVAARGTQDGRVHALLPLRRRHGVLSSPTNWHSNEFGLLADEPEAASFLLTEIVSRRPRRIALDFIEERMAGMVRDAAAACGYRVIHRLRQSSPYVSITGGWREYERMLGSKLCSDLRRRHRLLCQRGRVEFEVTSGERLDDQLEEGFAIEGSGWKVERGTAIRSRPETKCFYTEMARWAASRGWLRLGFLRLDGRPLAFNLCLERGRTHYLLKTGFDPEHRDLAPGKLLRHEMLTRAFEGGLATYEFLGESSPSKLECTSTTRDRYLVQGFRPSPLGVLDWTAFAIARPLVKRLVDKVRRNSRQVPLAAH